VNIQPYLHDAQLFTLVLVCVTFTGIVAYALWPSMQSNFDRASRLPLSEE
jgi:cytochrome c oxidase cbb3-type subunit IV